MDLASPALKNNSIPDRGCNSLIKSEQNELPPDLLSASQNSRVIKWESKRRHVLKVIVLALCFPCNQYSKSLFI